MAEDVKQGWQCPVCLTVYAPTVEKCECVQRPVQQPLPDPYLLYPIYPLQWWSPWSSWSSWSSWPNYPQPLGQTWISKGGGSKWQ